MPELWEMAVLLGIGVVAGFLNVMAGGGSTLTLPALIFLGLDPTVANGTNRIAIFIQNIAAITSFKREKYSEFGLSLKMAAFTLPGGILGAIVATRIGDELFQVILGIIMIGIVITMLIPKKKITEADAKTEASWPIYLAMFIIGFYGGFIQAGVGFLLMAALNLLMNLNLVHTNMHKVFIVLVFTIPAIIVFVVTGNMDYILGFVLAIGNAVGGWFSAKVAIKKGEKFIRIILVIAIIIMSLKMLGLF